VLPFVFVLIGPRRVPGLVFRPRRTRRGVRGLGLRRFACVCVCVLPFMLLLLPLFVLVCAKAVADNASAHAKDRPAALTDFKLIATPLLVVRRFSDG
jgi:hypothetical protein